MVQLLDVVSFSRQLTLVRCTVSDLEWNARSSPWQPDHDVKFVLFLRLSANLLLAVCCVSVLLQIVPCAKI